MTKTLGVIPARYGSTRFPGKPLVKIAGKSLVQRTYERALLCKQLDLVVIATDDERIFEHVKKFGGVAVMTSVDCQNGTDRIHQVLSTSFEYHPYDIVVNIQGDEPLVDPLLITKIIQMLKEDPSASVATGAAPLKDENAALSPSTVKCVVDINGNALYFSRSLIPGGKNGFNPELTYLRHIGIYGYRKEFIKIFSELPPSSLQLAEDLEQLKVLENGYRIKVAVGPYQSLDVNDPEDVRKVEEFLCKNSFS